MKKLFLILALVAVSTGAFAQDKLSFGVEAGANMSNFSMNDNMKKVYGLITSDANFSPSMRLGFQVGGYVDYSLTDMIFLEGGLYGIQRGFTYSKDVAGITYSLSANPFYLQVPIMVGFNFPISDGMALNAKVGPYVAYGITGNVKTEIEGMPGGIGNGSHSKKFFGDNTNALDFGAKARVGAEFSKFTLGLFFDYGFANIDNTDTDPLDIDLKETNYSIGLSVGYKF